MDQTDGGDNDGDSAERGPRSGLMARDWLPALIPAGAAIVAGLLSVVAVPAIESILWWRPTGTWIVALWFAASVLFTSGVALTVSWVSKTAQDPEHRLAPGWRGFVAIGSVVLATMLIFVIGSFRPPALVEEPMAVRVDLSVHGVGEYADKLQELMPAADEETCGNLVTGTIDTVAIAGTLTEPEVIIPRPADECAAVRMIIHREDGTAAPILETDASDRESDTGS